MVKDGTGRTITSREKFGRQITLTGDDPIFVARMARLAEDIGLSVLNPELMPVIEAHREAKKQAAGKAAKEAAQAAFKPRAQEDRKPTMSDGSGQASETDLQAQRAVGQGTGAHDALAGVTSDFRPLDKPAIPASAEERLRALVLAIDPRAKLEVADPADQQRIYVGPVASSLVGDEAMFAQHLGRSTYVLHRQVPPVGGDQQVLEVRYRAGQAIAIQLKTDKGQGR